MSGSASGSDSGSNSGGSVDWDEETARHLRSAPPHARICRWLSEHVSELPKEVSAALEATGAGVASWKLLKTSFHATFLVELQPPLPREGGTGDATRAIVQVLGAQLGDKALFQGPLSAATITKASELSARTGVRVPAIFAAGCCSPGSLDFVIQEFIQTETVEDEHMAPRQAWGRIASEVEGKLRALPLDDNTETEPLPRFASLEMWLQWLLAQVPSWDDSLRDALTLFTETVVSSPPASRSPVLLHQDVNDGNLLCSTLPGRPQEWGFDALIDWESAAVGDARFLQREEDPWRTSRLFSLVVKGSGLAQRLAQQTLPRCELEALAGGYEHASRSLDQSGLLRYQTWGARATLACDASKQT